MNAIDTRVRVNVAHRRCAEKYGTDGAFAIAARSTRGGAAIFVEVARGAESREHENRTAPTRARRGLRAWLAGLWSER